MEGKRGSECLLKSVSNIDFNPPRFKELFGNGNDLGLNIEYAVQEHPNGLAEAFVIGADFIGDDSVCLILGDNIYYGGKLQV
ncbi:hypothetical protein FD49_GL001119 [Latilactobacillus sakei subsp. sakei DSM 20017 = JCM 1157]|nr:hypothetical protein FD49_GL001119 [Latilactobacillus sakei subsp. sakei DSM 20017 = JCM 1157]TDG58941.1 hypothetical protein C5L17_000790 [Latilactobacillus sakei subsp. sakei]USG00522.1 hypothetical protein BHU02_07760 [Latilactobacillus sakei subsp. sakei]BAX66393.1 glucose-1-phosphate thymidylyltransferase [Latilactobacillus sakei subsp. sakei DSM 20017 = JCM 1157]